MVEATVYQSQTFSFAKGLPEVFRDSELKSNQMLKHLHLALFFTLLTAVASAQSNTEDVVYLKNGSIIRGSITEHKIGDKLKIELAGGSVFVFSESEIDSTKKENIQKRQLQRWNKLSYRKNRGYMNMTEFGFIYGTNLKKDNNQSIYYGYSPDDFGVSIHTVNGYRHWPYLFTGAGVGIDRFINYKQTFSPFYLRLQSEFLKKKTTPYIQCDVGYAVMWKQKSEDYVRYKNTGGLYISAGGGVRIYTHSRASVIIGVTYKRLNSKTEMRYTYTEGDPTVYITKRVYQRVALSVGVAF